MRLVGEPQNRKVPAHGEGGLRQTHCGLVVIERICGPCPHEVGLCRTNHQTALAEERACLFRFLTRDGHSSASRCSVARCMMTRASSVRRPVASKTVANSARMLKARSYHRAGRSQ